MDPVQIYSIAAGGIFFALFLYRFSFRLSLWVQKRTLYYVFKYLIYPTLIERRRFLTPFTRRRVLLTLLYWVLTATCNFVGVNSLAQAGTRAGTLAVVNLAPLFFVDRLSFAADLLGFSLHTYTKMHHSIGAMAVLQALIHVAIFLSSNSLLLRDQDQFNGLLVGNAQARQDEGY